MAISGVETKCYILSLFIRDDGERFVLGSGYYEFKDVQLHFQANTIANDVVEVQGNDGYLLAGQVRRPGTQVFDGYVADGTVAGGMIPKLENAFQAISEGVARVNITLATAIDGQHGTMIKNS